MIKAIFFDIDGTLVSFKTHEISRTTLDALYALKEKGIRLFIASGRHLLIMDNLSGFPFDGYVCMNGALVFDQGEMIYSRPLDRDDTDAVIGLVEENRIPCVIFAEKEIVINLHNELTDRVFEMIHLPKPEPVPFSGYLGKPVCQFTIFLNGEKTIFRGVCLHHDLGPLGGAVNKAAIERQLRILKDMGCNAIRTSHNMPAPELVDACDEMGIMMMAESFDEWAQPKCQNGYNLLFDEWAEKDLVNLVRHYRNNPCVVMWSIGNEIPEQGVRGGNQIARFLRDICHREDPTRPVTQGMNNVEGVVSNGFASVMDIVGLNYHPGLYPKAYELLPQQLVLGAETISALSSRGIYKFPLERRVMHKYDDHQASSYGVDHVGWGCLPEDHFIQYEDYPWCMGEFVWTGFDYLGEPTPYYSDWPSHSSLFGIVDLAGIPKDLYYLYRSFWNPEEETLHILPHWNWEGREGEVTPVFVYTNYPSAELFINGKSQGKRTKDLSVKVQDSGDKDALNAFERQKRYRLMWMDTKYEPGTLKVVAYDAEGKPVAEREIHTAGKPYRIELSADRTTLKADGRDLAFITVKVVDEAGNLCPEAANLIRFKVKGAGTYRAAANGDPTCTYLFHKPEMPLFSGMLTAIVQSSEEGGKIRFEASAKGIRGAVLELDAE